MESQQFCVLGDVLAFYAKQSPTNIAITFEGRDTTYLQLDQAANQVASGLVDMGIQKHERVCILSKNSDRFLGCLFGVNRAGAVLTPINWRLAPLEIEYILEDSAARVIFVDDEAMPMIAESARKKGIRTIALGGGFGGDIRYDAWLEDQPIISIDRAQRGDDIAVQMYTSGTTGRPKGAMLANRNFIKLCDLDRAPTPEWFRLHNTDISLVAIPLFHVGGLESALRSIFSGGRVIIHREFDAELVLLDIARYRVTKAALVPTALQMVIQHPKAASTDFASLNTMAYGASPIPLDLLRQAIEVIDCDFMQCYGMTEALGTIVTLPPADHTSEGNKRMRSAGIPLPGVEVKVVDGTGQTLASGSMGEIAVRGPSVMMGYWNQPEATREAIDDRGWLRTGDAGYLDEDGYVYIQDRVKDMIVSGAENIYPAEVESAIFGHSQVLEVAVIGVPDDRWGESVKAIVVPKSGEVINAAELIAWTKTRIASYKAPRSIDFVTSLPRNAAGKVMKTELRRKYWKDRDRAVN